MAKMSFYLHRFLSSLLVLSISLKAVEPVKVSTSSLEPSPPPLTVWVHGSKGRPATTFFRNFFYCPDGLTKATDFPLKYHYRCIANSLSFINPERFSLNNFYFFGWSGNVSFSERERTAKKLYNALLHLTKNYQETYGQKPFIRVITHSHGGNVALNLPFIKPQGSELYISELILLACPIQMRTKWNSQDSMFKKVISLYSTLDTYQVIDPQGLYKKGNVVVRNTAGRIIIRTPLFSRRKLDPYATIKQAKIKINGRGIFHVEFLMKRFLNHLPAIISLIEEYPYSQGKKKLLISITRQKKVMLKEL